MKTTEEVQKTISNMPESWRQNRDLELIGVASLERQDRLFEQNAQILRRLEHIQRDLVNLQRNK